MTGRFRPRWFTVVLGGLCLVVVAVALVSGGLFADLFSRGSERAPLPPGLAPADSFPVPVVFDTDVGHDVDDALALGLLHALASRGECRLLAVTSSNPDRFSVPFCRLVNGYYGRAAIPVGSVPRAEASTSRFLRGVVEAAGPPRDPSHGEREPPRAVALLREVLAAQPDASVVFIATGRLTNPAGLLNSTADGASPWSGIELVRRKVRWLAVMAGAFRGGFAQPEFNIAGDVPAAQKVFAQWPTPIVCSGYEVGDVVRFPVASVLVDFRYDPRHPLQAAYVRYMPMPYEASCWDPTAVLFAVRPQRGYFGISEPGRIIVDTAGRTALRRSPAGRHWHLTISARQSERVRELLAALVSQPPMAPGSP